MSKSKSSDSYCSLYSFIKDNNVELFNILEDTCSVGLFRPRNPVTFLNPSPNLTKELVAMVDEGKSEDAFVILQSLFIYGKHDKLNNDMVSYNRKTYSTDISGLKKDNSFSQWKIKDNTSVFVYDLPKFPKEGKSTNPPKLVRPKRDVEGGNEDGNKKVEVTEHLFKSPLPEKLAHNVAYHLNSLLEHIKKEDESLFKELSLLMDPNMIVSWFILVQPSKSYHVSNPHISNQLFNSWKHNDTIKSVNLIKEIFDSNNNNNNSLLAEISNIRKEISREGFNQTKNSIEQAYKNDFEKLLEDELRFRFSDEDKLDEKEIHELKHVNWENPKESLVIVTNAPESCLYKPEIHNMMCKFIDSNAFKYTLFNNKIHTKLSEIDGAGVGNANIKKMINILGNKNRNFIKSLEKTDDNKELTKFISSLSSKQVSILKNILSDFD